MKMKVYLESLRRKGLYFCLQEAWKRVCPVRWVGDKGVMDVLHENRAYRWLRRRYLPLAEHYEPEQCQAASRKTIWVCWLQGEDQAPELVRRCIASMRAHAGDYEVCVVTNENLPSLIDIPDCITRALQKHWMQYATYSDYIRVALLEKYGGVWIDATVLLTAPIPDYVLGSELFFFQAPPFRSNAIAMSSWFLSATAGQRTVSTVRFLMEAYWKRERRLVNYYLFHLLLTMVVTETENGRNDLRAMPYESNAAVHLMQKELFEPYNERRFAEYRRVAFCHKLTYKTRNAELLARQGTNYKYITNNI